MKSRPEDSERIPRNTIKNFFLVVRSGDSREFRKIMGRRLHNFVRAFRILFLRIFGIYYYHPAVEKKRQKQQLRTLLTKQFDWVEAQPDDSRAAVAIIVKDGSLYPKSSAFIRLISPLTDASLRKKISIQLYSENTTRLNPATKICIVQRNAYDNLDTAQKLVNCLREKQIPLILDSDDAFHSIDVDHPEHDEHKPTLEAFAYLAREANQIWASTDKLAAHFKTLNPKVNVIENGLDPRLWAKTAVKKHPKNNGPIQMIYMGTVSHNADFAMILPALNNVAAKYPGSFKLTVIGVASSLPEEDWIERIYQKRGGSIYPRFVRWFLKQGPYDIGLSPLVDNDFNRGKSDIKCLDYLAAGITPIVSDIGPYKTARLSGYIVRVQNTTDAWEQALTDIVTSPETFRKERAQLIEKARDYIMTERSSSVTAKKINKTLTQLLPESE